MPDPFSQALEPALPSTPGAASAPAGTRLATTGSLVVDLWNTTEQQAPLEGWEVDDTEVHRRLPGRRRGRALVALGLLALVVVAGATILERRDLAHGASLEAVATAVEDLDAAGRTMSASLDAFASDPSAGLPAASAAVATLDRSARSLFEAAAALDPEGDDRDLRVETLTVAQQALEIESALGDAFAYAGGLSVFVDRPGFPTAVSPDDVPTLAADVAWWVGRFVDGAASLPRHPLLDEHRSLVTALADDLPDWQAAYLGALRGGDDEAAREQLERLDTRLEILSERWERASEELRCWGQEAFGVLFERMGDVAGAVPSD